MTARTPDSATTFSQRRRPRALIQVNKRPGQRAICKLRGLWENVILGSMS